ncbi:MAG: T9SS type A sorting domain-containing protein, partial [Flavobacteriales bacterium]|nr:T9SS type A sorting domain-containing protein [Flavobacteriales bacterium]
LTLIDNVSVSNTSDNSFISGPIEKIGNDAFIFPIGKNGNYQPIYMTSPSTSSFTAEYFDDNSNNLHSHSNKEVSIDHLSSCEYWNLTRNSGNGNVKITLSWDGNSCGVTNLNDLIVSRWDGTQWENEGGSTTTGNNIAGTVRSLTNVSGYGPFTLGSSSLNNPLPVELIDFDAIANEDKVEINWSTVSEINNDYFTIERSKDGVKFKDVMKIEGAGNSSNTRNYFEIDNKPIIGLSYYRLKQTDFDGSIKYSRIVPVRVYGNNEIKLTIYPNPLRAGSIPKVSVKGIIPNKKVLILVRDITGKEMFTKVIIGDDNGSVIEGVDQFNKLPAGTYLIIGSSNQKYYSKKLIIQQLKNIIGMGMLHYKTLYFPPQLKVLS